MAEVMFLLLDGLKGLKLGLRRAGQRQAAKLDEK